MVPCLRGVVEQWPLRMGYDFFKLHVFEFGAFDEPVQVVDICFLVLAVVEIDGASADGRFESVVVVGQLRLFVGHSYSIIFCDLVP